MKAIITDLDRTLLRTDKSVSEYTADVIKRCHERGLLVMAASARPPREIERYNELLGFDAICAMNGAIVKLPDKNIEFSIPRKSGEQILDEILQIPDVFLSIETSGGLYSNRDIPAWKPMIYDDFPKLPENTLLYKILISTENEALYQDIEKHLTDDVYHTIANKVIIQIMSKNATKYSGIEYMLTHYGISPSEAVYFGDDYDDIGPIKKCAIGVAVSNAIPPVLEAADVVVDTNDNDGVAKYIDGNIL